MLELEITSEAFAQQRQQQHSPLLLDVREPWEYQTASIPGSLLMPMGEVPSRAHTELDPDASIVVMCHHGARSLNVALWLRDQGFTHAQSLEQAQEFRAEMRARAAAKGRNPDDVLIMPGIFPVIAETDEAARAKAGAIQGTKSFDRALRELGRPFGWHDFSQYDLDAPFPDVGDAGERSFRTQAQAIKKLARDHNYTLRQVVDDLLQRSWSSSFVGSPATVADQIEHWFSAGGFDGINLSVTTPSDFALFTDTVLPILRERGLVRRDYDATTLRGNLGLPAPENRHTAARRAPVASAGYAGEAAGREDEPALA